MQKPPQNRTQTAKSFLIWVLLKSAWKPEFIGIYRVQKYQNWERLGKVKKVIFSVENFLLPHKTKGLWYILNITSWRARRCLWGKKNCFKKHPMPPLSVQKKIQPKRSSRLAVYRQDTYTNVLFYYIDFWIKFLIINWLIEIYFFLLTIL